MGRRTPMTDLFGERQHRAADMLAQIIADHAGVNISPLVLAELITERWGTISALAHIIHGSSPLKPPPLGGEVKGVPINDMGQNAF